ncbi:MAG TPA: efflux RND transporter periplasmic adaptor subunit [Isosphaeraceae bacterium]|nr:efflux RND transporter periplasmic adaptor subunit [Isosphaeraceae bacterium]
MSRTGKGESGHERGGSSEAQKSSSQAPTAQVIKPTRGGTARITDQPGTVRAFERATLYAKVSGYLKELRVDRGDPVMKDQVLAQIYVPELDVAVLQAESSLQHSRALATQAEARVKAALAGVQAAEAKQKQAVSVLEEAVATREYRKKALDRITELARRNAAEQRLVDEYEDQYMASLASEHSAQSGIQTAEAQIAEAKAAVGLAEADVATAKTEIKVSEANLQRAKVMVSYTRIESPFDGVVTFRGDGIHPGAFIRSAADGISEPLLAVATNDRMRTIVQVPDPDVPFCNVGDPANIKIDALGGRIFKGKVSRMADAEDLKDRTMRVEIDLLNDQGLLRDGMYGRAVIELEPPSKNLTIPSTCLIEQNGHGDGAVFVVRDGKVTRVKIRVGKDSGLRVEVLSGLSEDDQVIAQITPSITEGTIVRTEPAKAEEKKSSND